MVAIEGHYPLRDALQHQILLGEAVDYGLRLQIQQGAPQPVLQPERQQQAAAQHGADGADEQGYPLQIDALHSPHQIAHRHRAYGAPVRPYHGREAADGRAERALVPGAVTAPLLDRRPDVLATEGRTDQLGGGVAQAAGVLVRHHHVGGIGAAADPLYIVPQAGIIALLQGLHHPAVRRQHPGQIAPLLLQVALQQVADEEGEQPTQDQDQQQ
ncbi:hypothetical protein D3C75_804210 [compost metagenome]